MIEILKQGRNDGVIHCRSKETGTWLSHFQSHLHLSPERVHELFVLGSIYDEKNRLHDWAYLEKPQSSGSYVRIHTEPRRYDLSQLSAKNLVLHEEADFFVALKPPALPCHPTVDNQVENLISYLEHQQGRKLYLTHRLDLGTQGLLVIAKSNLFQKNFNHLLSVRQIQKKYRAWTEKKIDFSTPRNLVHWMKLSPKAPKTVSAFEFQDGIRCELEILQAQSQELQIRLITGRTHQIRAQLSEIGFPILGDTAYGSQSSPWGKDHWALQAFELQLPEELKTQKRFFQTESPSEILRSLGDTSENKPHL